MGVIAVVGADSALDFRRAWELWGACNQAVLEELSLGREAVVDLIRHGSGVFVVVVVFDCVGDEESGEEFGSGGSFIKGTLGYVGEKKDILHALCLVSVDQSECPWHITNLWQAQSTSLFL